jgi:hypothetical protein
MIADCRLAAQLFARTLFQSAIDDRQSTIAQAAGGFVVGAGSAWAFTSDWKSTFLCVPSQKGLFAE